MDRGAGKATVHGITKSWTLLKLHSMHIHIYIPYTHKYIANIYICLCIYIHIYTANIYLLIYIAKGEGYQESIPSRKWSKSIYLGSSYSAKDTVKRIKRQDTN